jgi:hypothetical protein
LWILEPSAVKDHIVNNRFEHLFHISEGDLALIVYRVIEQIASLQMFPRSPSIPIIYTNAPSFGGYVPDQDRVPRHILLSRRGPHPDLTFVHELGHFFDHAMGEFAVYSTMVKGSELDAIVRCLEQTQCIKSLRERLTLPNLPLMERWQIGYWLDPRELWARAYAQFVALRSDSELLRQQIALSMALTGLPSERYVQWQEDDFLSVVDPIEAALKGLG